jgi:DNA-binding NarL/FixJ family response regulator
MSLKEYQKAEDAFLKSIELSKPGNLNRNIMNSMEHLAELYRQTGRFEKAFYAQEEFMQFKDSLFNAETQKKITEFQVKYELDIKQQENEILKRDQELERKIHVNTRLYLSLLALVLVIILLTLAIRLKINQNHRLKAEKENEALRADLEQRNKELTYNAMCIVKTNETMAKMVEAVDTALESDSDQHKLKAIVHQLQKMEQDKSWEEFEYRFIQTHQAFYDKLQVRFPDLTPNERKLCAFLRLNMSTKDIAAITHQSVNSINVARTRLRKKLGIDDTDENLVGFLHSL